MTNEEQHFETKEVFDRWNNELKSICELRDKSNDLIGERLIMLLGQKSELFKSLITLSIGFLAVPYFLKNIKNNDYYFVAIVIFITLVIFIVLYLREFIDSDILSLRDLQDEYNEIAEAKQNLILEYQSKKIFTYDADANFRNELRNSSSIKKLKERMQKEKNNKLNKDEQIIDRSGMLIMFLFLSGILWILLSIAPKYFNWISIISLEIIIMIFVSNNSVMMIFKVYSYTQHYIRKLLK